MPAHASILPTVKTITLKNAHTGATVKVKVFTCTGCRQDFEVPAEAGAAKKIICGHCRTLNHLG